jgi:N-6 DNA Methylase./Eco57I restriction endonuclease.
MLQTTLEFAFKTVKKLVEDFEGNKDFYLAPSYSEQSARHDFIDKFFIALGWDVNHETEKNPYEQEAKIELNVNVRGKKKRADYAFYLAPNFRDVVFYAEAKKPSVQLANADDYFQTIRYGYNSETPLAILTDFEQFHILDCRYAPSIETALDRFVRKYTYQDYLNKEKFAEIYYLFSREAIAGGSIEKRALELPKARGGAIQLGLFKGAYKPIDESLLDDLDGYRKTLAQAFKNGNPDLDHWALTEIVQRVIDRLVFIRFLEDKLIEPEDIISNFGTKSESVWKDFVSVCRKLDKVYNGTIYKKHDILDAPDFSFDENAFADICEKLSSKNTPYDFDKIPIHILGSIYERFLGKVITTSAKRAKVEEKPEVKKAGGVFYTPEYIVRYIVENTIGKLTKDKTPEEISKMRFADIACGSGSFLLGAYDSLLRYHANYYNKNPKEATQRDCIERDGALILSLHKKREILLNNIYGVDIDQQAVEVSQLSLYLKLLENETLGSTAASLRAESGETVLPPLNKNIQCGNSLVGPDFYEGVQEEIALYENKKEEVREINSFDWNARFSEIMKDGAHSTGSGQGFDAIIGNPPYVRQEMLGEFKAYFERKYKVFAGTADLYVYFFERAHKILKNGGLFGMICSNKFMRANYGKSLRDFLSTETQLLQIIDFGELPVFENAATFPAVFLTCNRKTNNQKFVYAPIKRLDFESLEKEVGKVGSQLDSRALTGDNWTLASGGEIEIIEKMKKVGVPLGEYSNTKIYRGVLTGFNEAFIINNETRKRLIKEDTKSKEVIKPFVAGDDVRKYRINYKDKYLIFTRRGININKYPAIRKHLLAFQEKLMPKPKNWKGSEWKGRKPGTYEWYEIQDSVDYFDLFEKPKILYPDIAKESRMSYDTSGLFAGNTIYFIPTDDLYLLGLLNSRLIFFYFRRVAAVLGDAEKGGRLRWFNQDVIKIPIKKPDEKSDKSRHDEIVSLVTSLLALHQQLPQANTDFDKERLTRHIESADHRIDELVYELYGLTDEEIKIVERAVKGKGK